MKSIFLKLMIVVLFVLCIPSSSVAGPADQVRGVVALPVVIVNNISKLFSDQPDDILSSEQKEIIRQHVRQKGNDHIVIGNPLKSMKVSEIGMVLPYECKSRGQDRIMLIAGHIINKEFKIKSVGIMTKENYNTLASYDNDKQQYHLTRLFPKAYGPPEQPEPKVDK